MITFIKTQKGDYVKISDITLIYTDNTNHLCCVAGICPKIKLGEFHNNKRCEEVKTELITHLSNPETLKPNISSIYEMPNS